MHKVVQLITIVLTWYQDEHYSLWYNSEMGFYSFFSPTRYQDFSNKFSRYKFKMYLPVDKTSSLFSLGSYFPFLSWYRRVTAEIVYVWPSIVTLSPHCKFWKKSKVKLRQKWIMPFPPTDKKHDYFGKWTMKRTHEREKLLHCSKF